jgi:hypothetical protein
MDTESTPTRPVLRSMLDVPESEREPMSERATKWFMMSTLRENEDEMFTADFAAPFGFPGQILSKRLSQPGRETPITQAVAVFVLLSCNSPGLVVLWALMLYRLHRKNAGLPVTMQSLAFAFPMGFPTAAAMGALWDSQKGYSNNLPDVDNLIDDPTYWEATKTMSHDG